MSTPAEPTVVPAPEPAPKSKKRSKALGVASLVLGIVSVATAFIPFWSYAVIGLGAIALILGVLALVFKRGVKSGVAGLILGAVGLILAIIATTIYAAIFFGVSKAVDDETKKENKVNTVVLEVTGAAKNADVDYNTNEKSANVTDVKLPWSMTFKEKAGIIPTYSVIASNGIASDGTTDTGSITCKITVNGKVVKTSTSSGSMASASCNWNGN